MPKAVTNRETSRTATTYELRRPVSADTGSVSVSVTRRQSQPSSRDVETAVYTYIRALRSLGKTQVNTAEIARALGVPVSNVSRILPKLTEKGIRRAG